MKGKKCIKLLTLCITFLLSLSLSLNASAKVKSVDSRYFDTFQWYYNGSTQQTANVTNGGLINNITLSANGGSASTLSLMKFNLRSNARLNKDTIIRFKVFFVSSSEYREVAIFPSCPRGANNFIIDKCSISNADLEQMLIYLGETTPISPYLSEYTVGSNVKLYHVMDIEGHYNYENYTNISTIETYNTFYTFVNTTQAPFNTSLIMFIPPIEFVIEEDTPQDEAAEKELEDRDNLESQSTTTDSEAGTASNAAETTGTTLFGAFTQLLTALTNVSGSSCTLPSMQVYSLNLGRMDLCTYTIPSQISALVSIGMVFIIVPLGIHLVKRMINLYKEITG